MEQNFNEFQNPRRRKKDIWIDISKELNCQSYFWGPQDCRKKWSNMIRTFKVIFENRGDPVSSKRSRWGFYDQMLKLFSLPCAQALPESGPVMAAISGFHLEESLDEDNRGLAEWKLVRSTNTNSNTSDATDNTIVIDMGTDNDGKPLAHQSATIPTQDDINEDQDQEDVNAQLENFMATEVIEAGYRDSGEDVEVLSQCIIGHSSQVPSEESQSMSVDIPDQVPHHEQEFRSTGKQVRGMTTSSHFTHPSLNLRHGTGSRKRKQKTNRGSESEDSLVEQFMTMTREHNERVISLMTKFHDETMDAMRERNSILREFSDALKQDLSS